MEQIQRDDNNEIVFANFRHLESETTATHFNHPKWERVRTTKFYYYWETRASGKVCRSENGLSDEINQSDDLMVPA